MDFIKKHPLFLGGLLLIISLIMTLYIPLFVANHTILMFYLLVNIVLYYIAYILYFWYFSGTIKPFYIISFIFYINLVMYVTLDIKDEYIKENNNVYKVRYIRTFLTNYKLVFKRNLKNKK